MSPAVPPPGASSLSAAPPSSGPASSELCYEPISAPGLLVGHILCENFGLFLEPHGRSLDYFGSVLASWSWDSEVLDSMLLDSGLFVEVFSVLFVYGFRLQFSFINFPSLEFP